MCVCRGVATRLFANHQSNKEGKCRVFSTVDSTIIRLILCMKQQDIYMNNIVFNY